MEPDSCNVCGGTDSKLIDGFYYCIECGTQNTNVRETIIEEKTLGDGTFAQSNRRKIIQLKEDGIEMSGEWYRWHAFNFIISGLADDLVLLGAKSTFKTKLLWIWTRYIMKYQNKSELTMHKSTNVDSDQNGLPSFMIEEDSIPEAKEIPEEDISLKRNKCDIEGSRRDIKFLSIGVIIAMLYLALNLDESEIQLSHLYRFIQERHLNISNLKRFIPDEINVKKIPQWLNFIRSKLCTQHQLRALAMSLLRQLDLGTPKVPDLKKIVDNFLTELCLPNDIKPLIYSLLHFRKCNFLDISNHAKKYLIRIPDYEGTVMTYILVAIKICFGLDDNYEIKLSNIVEKINEEGDLQKSYKIGKYSESSDRLFSFREWCSYIQFRKVMLSKYNLRIAEENFMDIDDYVYMEQMEARPKNNEELPDKISIEIISRLPQDHHIGVIPKELFTPTLTPLTEYTELVIEHCQDPEVKLMLAEDFKRYSLKYACENLELMDSNMENVVKGASEDKKQIENGIILGTIVMKKAKTNMVYVKNCENRNWLKTNPPTMDHVTWVKEENEINDKESDHGYDSENTSKENDQDTATDNTEVAQSVVDETLKEIPKEVNPHEIITEEDLEANIFDDDFEDLDFKEECERDNFNNSIRSCDGNETEGQVQNNEFPDEDLDRRSDISDEPLVPQFNPETFDKEKTIKELILFACSRYKIPVPSEYKTKEPRKRKDKTFGSESGAVKRLRKVQREGKVTAKELLSNYYNNLESDFVSKMQQEMRLAVRYNEFESMNLEENVSNLHIGVVNRSSETENRADVATSHSDRNSPVGPIDENVFDGDVTNKTHTNERAGEIGENIESKLFEDDEEMNLDDLIPKGDPKFEEKKYDVNQLYIEVTNKKDDVFFDIKDDPELDEVLLNKIKECELGIEFENLQPNEKDTIDKKDDDSSDSEDEIPLTVFKEEALLIEDMLRQEEKYENFIKKPDIPEYKYWIRHYDPDFMLRSADWHTKFNEELKENMPISFCFIIQECASILNCTKFYLYKNMQFVEEYLLSKAKNAKANLQDTSNFLIDCER